MLLDKMPGIGSRVGLRASFLLLAAVLLIFYITLFPFDFVQVKGISVTSVFEEFDTRFFQGYLLGDFLANILLFLPLGFALANIGSVKRKRRGTTLAVILAAGLFLSISVETLQMFLLRFSSFVDVLANTLGVLFGGLVSHKWGGLIVSKVEQLWEYFTQRSSITSITAIFLLYATLILAISVVLRKSSDLYSWDPSFPLIIGNERTGDRPWQGKVTDVFLSDQALSGEEISKIVRTGDFSDLDQNLLLAHYLFTVGEDLNDPVGSLLDLRWHNGFSGAYDQDGVQISSINWIESQAPVSLLTNRIRSSSQFTLGIFFASFDQFQTGPARIFSISTDPYLRNMTIGQEGSDLIFRLRTPLTGENGRKPEFVISDFFTDEDFHHLIITYEVNTLRFYLDGNPEPYLFEFSPEIMLFWIFPPSKVEQIRLNAFHPLLFKLLFYSLTFTPPILLSILFLRKVKVKDPVDVP